MSRQRLERIKRLTWLREQQRDAAMGNLARAQAKTFAARTAAEQAEAQWMARARVITETREPRLVADYAAEHAHLEGLGQRCTEARATEREAEGVESHERAVTEEAQRELRRMELWSDAETARARAELMRRERNHTDELAAKITQRNKP